MFTEPHLGLTRGYLGIPSVKPGLFSIKNIHKSGELLEHSLAGATDVEIRQVSAHLVRDSEDFS
jgi:hypothetical protein